MRCAPPSRQQREWGGHDVVGYQHLRGDVSWRAAILRDGRFKEGGSEPAPRHARPHTF
jgi:hypothetical protein